MQRSDRQRSPRGGVVLPVSLAALLAASCGAPAPLPLTPAAPVAPPQPEPAPAAPLAPARWVPSGGTTAIGPEMETGTLVLLGGRRALVAPDGSVKAESAPSPEPLLELALVPTASGERRVVGRGAHGVYRLDDPLGAPVVLARSEAGLARIGAGPGVVAVWESRAGAPVLLDLMTGAPRKLAGLPDLPAIAMAFRSMTEGAVIFQGVGLATTTDGGASYRPVTAAVRGDGLRVTGLRLREAKGAAPTARAYIYVDGRDAEVDLAGARMGAMEERASTRGEAPLVRWIRATGRDPLEAAITSGVPAAPGVALAASHGLLARIDTATGLVLETAEFATGTGLGDCEVAREGGLAYFACALSEEREGDLYDPFGVFAVALEGKLAAQRPVVARNGEAELRASPGGGMMLLAACSADEEGDACVRQPDGRWVTFNVDVDLVERGAGPLADGRIALLRGLYEGDDIPGAAPEEGRGWPSAYAVAVDASGAERRLADSLWVGRASGTLHVQSPLQEGVDRALRFVLANDEGAFAFALRPGGAAQAPKRIDGARAARLAGDRGIAVGPERVAVTLDGGSTFHEIDLPAAARSAAARALAGGADRDAIVAGEVGAAIDTELCVGWGAAPLPAPAAPEAVGRPLREGIVAPAPRPGQVLRCTDAGASASAAFALGPRDAKQALATVKPAPKGTKRTASVVSDARAFGVAAMLEQEGPDRPGSAPATWTLRWHDPLEIGGKIHTWKGPAPKEAAFGAALRSASAEGGRALFAVRSGGKYLLVRADPRGIEVKLASFDLLPPGDVVFGAEAGEPVAWLSEGTLVVWKKGGAPEALAQAATQAPLLLGRPVRDGVPLVVGASDWTLTRTLPFPAKKASAGAEALPLGGWLPLADVRRDVGSLPACAAGAKGARFEVTRSALELAIDGVPARVTAAVYGVVASRESACVESIAAAFAPVKNGSSGEGISFLRADLRAGKGEGGALAAAGAVRRLSCALGPPR